MWMDTTSGCGDSGSERIQDPFRYVGIVEIADDAMVVIGLISDRVVVLDRGLNRKILRIGKIKVGQATFPRYHHTRPYKKQTSRQQ